MEGTAWTKDDLLVNLREEVKAVKEFYNVPTLEHVPDFELTRLVDAWHGDIVAVGKHVGIEFDVVENRGVRELSIVLNSLRVIIKRVNA